MITKCYSELISMPDYEDRLKYLKLDAEIGIQTFGKDRHLNQMLYHDPEWRHIRRKVLLRDSDGDHLLDLAHPDFFFDKYPTVHHIIPITLQDVLERDPKIFDMENLITCSSRTHRYIHYGKYENYQLSRVPATRSKNDTILWR